MSAVLASALFQGFRLDEPYRVGEIRAGAGVGFGALTAGINAKGRWPNTEAVILLSEVGNGPYSDHWEGPDLMYSGENDAPRYGRESHLYDQSLEKGRNRVLTYQREKKTPIYLFWRLTGQPKYRYAGLVEVADATLVPVVLPQGGQRLEAKYRLHVLSAETTAQVQEVETEMESLFMHSSLPPPQLTDPPASERILRQRLRDRVFRRKVKEAYVWQCAVCGLSRKNALGRVEVEAAHLYPRDLHGADDPRNGVALCRFHHWALDGHLFVIDDDMTVRCCHGGEVMEGLRPFDGQRLRVLPASREQWPHPLYLGARRQIAASVRSR